MNRPAPAAQRGPARATPESKGISTSLSANRAWVGAPGLLATPLRINGWVNWENAPARRWWSGYSFGATFSWGMAAPGLPGQRFAGFTQERVTVEYTQHNFLCRKMSKCSTNTVPTAAPLGRGQGEAPYPARVQGWGCQRTKQSSGCSERQMFPLKVFRCFPAPDGSEASRTWAPLVPAR